MSYSIKTGGGKVRDYSVDKIRVILSIFIVFIHAFNQTPAPDTTFVVWNNGLFDVIRIILSQGVARVGVPLFAVFAGFYMGGNCNVWTEYKAKIRNRINSLVFPYLLWNLLAFLFLFIFAYVSRKANSVLEYVDHWGGINSIMFGWGHTPINGPLWFIRDLFIVSLFSPFIHFFLARIKCVFVFALCLLYVLGLVDSIIPITVVTFFTIGYYCRMNGIQLLGHTQYRKIAIVLCVVTLFLSCAYYNINESYYFIANRLFQFSGSFVLISFFGKKQDKSHFIGMKLSDLGPFSFFLYASHYFATLPIVYLIMAKVCPPSTVCYIIWFLLIPIIVTFLTYIMYRALQSILPKILSIFLGHRV